MSTLYASDGKQEPGTTRAARAWTCYCGRVLRGSSARASHQRTCQKWAEKHPAPEESR
jgi:hypothetical protein